MKWHLPHGLGEGGRPEGSRPEGSRPEGVQGSTLAARRADGIGAAAAREATLIKFGALVDALDGSAASEAVLWDCLDCTIEALRRLRARPR